MNPDGRGACSNRYIGFDQGTHGSACRCGQSSPDLVCYLVAWYVSICACGGPTIRLAAYVAGRSNLISYHLKLVLGCPGCPDSLASHVGHSRWSRWRVGRRPLAVGRCYSARSTARNRIVDRFHCIDRHSLCTCTNAEGRPTPGCSVQYRQAASVWPAAAHRARE